MALDVSSTGVALTGLGCVLRPVRRSAPGVKGLLMICRGGTHDPHMSASAHVHSQQASMHGPGSERGARWAGNEVCRCGRSVHEV
jgi:hypothetical protein